jgi:alternate signal-mediated exported protein
MGGAGTLAYWTGTGTVTGGSISSGTLDLANPSCGSWALDAAGGPTTFDPATDAIVPGDTLTRTCTFDIVAVGNHLAADLSIGTPTYTGSNSLTSGLSASAVFTVGGASVTQITSADNGAVLSATVSVVFDPASDNTTQNLTAVLNDVTVTATQTHA